MPFYFLDAVELIGHHLGLQERLAQRLLLNALSDDSLSSVAKFWTETFSDQDSELQMYMARDHHITAEFWSTAESIGNIHPIEEWISEQIVLAAHLPYKISRHISAPDREREINWRMECYIPVIDYGGVCELLHRGDFRQRFNKSKRSIGRPKSQKRIIFEDRLTILSDEIANFFYTLSDRKIVKLVDPTEELLDEREARSIVSKARLYSPYGWSDEEYKPPPELK